MNSCLHQVRKVKQSRVIQKTSTWMNSSQILWRNKRQDSNRHVTMGVIDKTSQVQFFDYHHSTKSSFCTGSNKWYLGEEMAPLGFFSENVCTETKHLMVAQMLKNTKINVYNIILLKRVNFTRHSTNSLVLLLDFSSRHCSLIHQS